MKLKKDLEYLDNFLTKIEDVSRFNVFKTIVEKLEPFDDGRSVLNLSSKIQNLGITYKYFEEIEPFEYRLTEKGIKAKELGGHFEYEKFKTNKELKNWYNEPWIGYLIALITLLFAFYQGYQNHSLEKDISSSKKNVDSLKSEIDSLNIEFQFLEKKFSDLKESIEEKK